MGTISELDITEFFRQATPALYSGNQIEYGPDVAAITWRNAQYASMDWQILDSEDKRAAFRCHVRGYGAWSEAEIAAWTPQELNALLLQEISADMREAGLDGKDPDWTAYNAKCNAGRASGRIGEGVDGRVYYAIGE